MSISNRGGAVKNTSVWRYLLALNVEEVWLPTNNAYTMAIELVDAYICSWNDSIERFGDIWAISRYARISVVAREWVFDFGRRNAPNEVIFRHRNNALDW